MIARVDCAKTIQEEMKMRESKFKNYDALPLTLTAPEVGEVLGISRAAAYELVRSKDSLTSESAHGFLFQKTSLSSGLTSKRRWMDEIV